MTLADLKVGDPVVVASSGLYGGHRSVYEVIRCTKATIWAGQPGSVGNRYRRDNGRQIGWSGYGAPILLPGTPELLEEVQRANRQVQLIRELRAFDWSILDLTTLDQIAALLPS